MYVKPWRWKIDPGVYHREVEDGQCQIAVLTIGQRCWRIMQLPLLKRGYGTRQTDKGEEVNAQESVV